MKLTFTIPSTIYEVDKNGVEHPTNLDKLWIYTTTRIFGWNKVYKQLISFHFQACIYSFSIDLSLWKWQVFAFYITFPKAL